MVEGVERGGSLLAGLCTPLQAASIRRSSRCNNPRVLTPYVLVALVEGPLAHGVFEPRHFLRGVCDWRGPRLV